MQDNAGKTTLLYRLKVCFSPGVSEGTEGERRQKRLGYVRRWWCANMRGQIGEVVTTIPTIGFNVESVTYKNLNFNVWVSPSFSLSPPLDTCSSCRARLPSPSTTLSNAAFVSLLGPWRPNIYSPLLALLLCQHRRCNIRHRQHRH